MNEEFKKFLQEEKLKYPMKKIIPLLGLISCCYLLTGMTVVNWTWFGGWLVIGFVVYLLYGFNHSKLNKNKIKASLED